MNIKTKRLSHGMGLPLPKRATRHSACVDLIAAVEKVMTLKPGNVGLVPTGLILELPAGYEAQVRPRSGLALKHGIGVLNSPGTIDSDYRGEVGIILFNYGAKPFRIQRGDRIAQLAVAKAQPFKFVETKQLGRTRRSTGGFGHTGVRKTG